MPFKTVVIVGNLSPEESFDELLHNVSLLPDQQADPGAINQEVAIPVFNAAMKVAISFFNKATILPFSNIPGTNDVSRPGRMDANVHEWFCMVLLFSLIKKTASSLGLDVGLMPQLLDADIFWAGVSEDYLMYEQLMTVR